MAAQTDPRFGRCRYFVVVDLASGAVETLENPNCQSAGGAGSNCCDVGRYGSRGCGGRQSGTNAARTLGGGYIQINQVRPTVAETVQAYWRGELSRTVMPLSMQKFGMRMGGGRGEARAGTGTLVSILPSCGGSEYAGW